MVALGFVAAATTRDEAKLVVGWDREAARCDSVFVVEENVGRMPREEAWAERSPDGGVQLSHELEVGEALTRGTGSSASQGVEGEKRSCGTRF